MSVLILGKNSFIASHLNYQKAEERVNPYYNQIEDIINKYKPNTIINCIGFCGSPNVDQCEIEKNKTIIANLTIPTVLSEVCEKHSIHMIHLSSGCVFFGNSPHTTYHTSFVDGIKKESILDHGWKEEDFANPQSFYSKTKYACDLILGPMPHITSLRLRMPVSTKNHPRNLINKLLNYKDVLITPNSITFIDDLVNVIDFFVKNPQPGIFHIANPQTLTHEDILEEYRKYVPSHTYNKITEHQLSLLTKAKRSNCILNTSKVNSIGLKLKPSKEALSECMKKFVENKLK